MSSTTTCHGSRSTPYHPPTEARVSPQGAIEAWEADDWGLPGSLRAAGAYGHAQILM